MAIKAGKSTQGPFTIIIQTHLSPQQQLVYLAKDATSLLNGLAPLVVKDLPELEVEHLRIELDKLHSALINLIVAIPK
jgi:hypothetical protein